MEVEPAIGAAKAMFKQHGWNFKVKTSDDVKITGNVQKIEIGYADATDFALEYDQFEAPSGWTLKSTPDAFPLVVFENEVAPFFQDIFQRLFQKKEADNE